MDYNINSNLQPKRPKFRFSTAEDDIEEPKPDPIGPTPGNKKVAEDKAEESKSEPVITKKVGKKFETYKVKITSARLRYFSGPEMDSTKLGIVRKNDKFVVLEETLDPDFAPWGKIQIGSDFVWIFLKYTERIKCG